MAAKKGGLGKGLDSLITDKVNKPGAAKDTSLTPTEDQAVMVPINKVEPNKEQPRKHFNEDALLELSESIKQMGIIQPIVVQDRNSYYEIIAGERRWRAAKIAGLTEIPALIRDDDARKNKEISLIENMQREDLNAYEKAVGVKSLMEDYHLTQEEIAKVLGKGRSSIANTVRVLNLTPDVLELAKQGKLTEGHCKALLAITDAKKQYDMALRMIEKGESVRQAESKNRITKREKKLDPQYKYLYEDIEDRFQGFFGTKVKLDQGKRKGRIIIEYHNNEDLERMLKLIKEN